MEFICACIFKFKWYHFCSLLSLLVYHLDVWYMVKYLDPAKHIYDAGLCIYDEALCMIWLLKETPPMKVEIFSPFSLIDILKEFSMHTHTYELDLDISSISNKYLFSQLYMKWKIVFLHPRLYLTRIRYTIYAMFMQVDSHK